MTAHPLLPLMPHGLLLAPMAGYTDAAFRSVCLEQGAELAFTEMVSAEALSRDSRPTRRLLVRAEGEEHLCVQLFASNPQSAGRAARALTPLRPALVDLNCGCSVPKVLRAGCGAVLLQDPGRIHDIVAAIRDACPAPVSVKIRSGWDAASLNYVQVARQAVAGGAALVTLHPRIRAQGFGGRVFLEHLRELKEAVGVPVIGSGDLFAPEDAVAMRQATGCDGVMFARGALGNPFIFAAARALLEGRVPPPPPGAAERLATALRQLERAVLLYGETTACREMRKHLCAYTRGLPGGAELRRRAVRAESLEGYRRLVAEHLRSAPEAGPPLSVGKLAKTGCFL